MRQLSVFALALLVAGCAAETADAPADAGGDTPSPTADAPPPGPPEPMDFGPVEMGTAPDNTYSAEQIARGGELVRFGGCNDCHTPFNIDPALGMPAPDMSRMLSGHPRGVPEPQGTAGPGEAVIGATFTSFKLGFGTVYAMNLTPDIETGIGTWTEEMFLNIFRKARHLGGDGRPVLPPMPWMSVASLNDEDIVSIFAYLRSIPPIVNAVPSSEIPQPVLDGLAMQADQILEQMAAGPPQ